MTRTAEDTRVQREAAFWLSLIETGKPSEADTARFEQWLDEDPANAEAYDEIARLWRDSATLTHLGELERPQARMRPTQGKDGWRMAGMATAAVLLIGLALTLLRPFERAPEAIYATDIGEIREIVLADGSELTLGPKSRLEVAFAEAERRVMLETGETFFTVVVDAARPFVVAADGTTIRVVGTRFNVHEGPRGITVAVAEGQVEVETTTGPEHTTSDHPPIEQRRRLDAGEKAVASAARGLVSIERVPPDLPGAWRQGRLVYRDATLAEVIADANRYSRTPIAIGSAELAELRVFGTFRTDEIARMIADLEESLPVVAERSGEGGIVLQPAARSSG